MNFLVGITTTDDIEGQYRVRRLNDGSTTFCTVILASEAKNMSTNEPLQNFREIETFIRDLTGKHA